VLLGILAIRGMGNCSNGARVSRADVERRILAALKEKLIAPDLIAEFTRACQEEVNRLATTTPTGSWIMDLGQLT